MSQGAETLSRDLREEDDDILVLDSEPKDRHYGTYQPLRRAMGVMARAAAAAEFLRDTEALVGSGDRPDPPQERREEDWPEEQIVKIAA